LSKVAKVHGRPLGSTYRLQLADLGFRGATEVVPYLFDLGIETLYVSPVLQAASGSTHGYDVIDPAQLDPAFGEPADLEALLVELDRHGMRLLVDIVPNHMAAIAENQYFSDVLRLGRDSSYARYFDIDWEAGKGKIVLALLGAPVGEVIARGELSVTRLGQAQGSAPVLAYFDRRFPLSPSSVELLDQGEDLPPDVGEVLAMQNYRLAYWRAGRWAVNYRRFFDVDSLIGVRVEDPDVYEATHRRILELAADSRVAGVRVDHIDGLADPVGYSVRLAADLSSRRTEPARILVEKILARDEPFPELLVADGATGYEFSELAVGLLIDPLGAEKLAHLPGELGGVTRPSGFEELARNAKREAIRTLFPGPFDSLARSVVEAVEEESPGSDLAAGDVGSALAELTAWLSVYRTYLGAAHEVSLEDRRRLEAAAKGARGRLDGEGQRALRIIMDRFSEHHLAPSSRWSGIARRWQQLSGAVAAKGVEDTALYRFDGLVAAADVGSEPGAAGVSVEDFHAAMLERQRLTPGALNATTTHDTKRSEDVRARLAVLSEEPQWWAEHVKTWHSVFAQIAAELGGPDLHDELLAYESAFGIWPSVSPGSSDERRELSDRLSAYCLKAAREAKRRTSWIEPDSSYEAALGEMWSRLLGDAPPIALAAELDSAVARFGPAALSNSLALAVLRMCAPGVPDLYQGNEAWSPSLVDPDNRRPVDFSRLAQQLCNLDASNGASFKDAVASNASWAKHLVVSRCLRLRRSMPELFAAGTYEPLSASGAHHSHVVAFAREWAGETVVVVALRYPFALAGQGRLPVGAVWGDTRIVAGSADSRLRTDSVLHDVVTGESHEIGPQGLSVGQLLARLPVAVLTARSAT
jgi:(1->4)-alpha-D-glucan 1-alpha-D-glucosylmutase